MRLNVRAFSLACGSVWGLGVFLIPWWGILWDGRSGAVPLLGALYRGFTFTPAGSVIGLLWAFPDGLVVGALFAWLYNRLSGTTASGA
ncbi:MAG TPA: bacteriophage holin [Thermoanaerobaculia bacterium]|nr:bacteriophage holin [Thermoanaerobaculia bacterium]